ncbi:pirin family protein [Gynuella sp.]|uniref:pirin family protein n=1 Tax=Gynuella sp. TaxID=2969146 RepID=UPI003D1435EB
MSDSRHQRISGRTAELSAGLPVQRFIPTRERRMIGAWVFLDHIGPADISAGKGVQIGPHPHTGLQTFTWMIEGELLHRDSLDTVQTIRPGQVNLMTAGKGISHSEESPQSRSRCIHATQLWIALPDEQRFIEPAFEHCAEPPVTHLGPAQITVIAGSAFALEAPIKVYSPLMAAEIVCADAGPLTLPLQRSFEHGLLVLDGVVSCDGRELDSSELLYLATATESLTMTCHGPCRLLLIGGEPFNEDVLIWWNFLGRNKQELHDYVRRWNAAEDFGTVTGYDGDRLAAPLPPWKDQNGGT